MRKQSARASIKARPVHNRVTTVVSQAGRSPMSAVRESRSQASCSTSSASDFDPRILVAIAVSRGRWASKTFTSIVVTLR